jgi:alkyl hydroperoxide reductase subunit AhpF
LACGGCADQQNLLEELAALSSHIKMEVRDLVADAAASGRRGAGVPRAEALAGVRLASSDGAPLAVEGVFLEIGLTPNSEPVRELLALNNAGEIPVSRDQATSVPGLFAAGDVTDEREKQIMIAAGARAALAADGYLAALEQQAPGA